jgi:nucleoside-diphosphate-sugar epimerase
VSHRAIVLGGSGFVGSAIVRRLERAGWETVAMGMRELDLTAAEARERLAARLVPETRLLVLAAAATPDRVRGQPGYERNLTMANAVATAIADKRGLRLAYLSSIAVYGNRAGRFVEQDTGEATDHYGLGKMQSEHLLARACETAGVHFLAIRPSIVYGPSDSHTSYGPSRLAREYLAGQVELFGRGEDRRDFIYVEDVAEALLRLVEAEARGAFNVAEGRARAFAEVLDTLRRLRPGPVAVRHRERTAPLYHQEIAIERLRAAVPAFAPLPLEEGLRRTLDRTAP